MVVEHKLRLLRLGIDTYNEAIIYMRKDCHVCRSEGFGVHARILVTLGDRSIVATLNLIDSELLAGGYAGLSVYAWNLLGAKEGDIITVEHAPPLNSFSYVRSKIYGNQLNEPQISEIIEDIRECRYSDIQISSFLTASAGNRMNLNEIENLTKAMVETGERLSWGSEMVVDKHCVGGLPGNRTSPIVVSIVAAYGLMMPKTSSRAITSPSGTADTMEVLTPVAIDIDKMKQVVEKEKACLIWGGALSLSPADDILINVERVLDLDSEAQMVASILSKKIAAGSTHVLIDIPIGPTAKVRSNEMANQIRFFLQEVGENFNVMVKSIFTDGSQPVGRGIGPALEARDLVQVLKCDPNAPMDLRERALLLASEIIEFSPDVLQGQGRQIAIDMLDSGKAWEKFEAICKAQGGLRQIPHSKYRSPVTSEDSGKVEEIDNRKIAKLAKLAGAPVDQIAGVDLHVHVGDQIDVGDTLFTVHADSSGELDYALNYLKDNKDIIKIDGASL